MNIAVIEDDKIWQEKITYFVKKFLINEKEVTCRMYFSGEEFLNQTAEYDIVFMDVELQKQDGFETGKAYKSMFPESILIMVTTHKEWCNKGYQASAFRYLDKANLEEEIKEAIESAKEKLIQQQIFRFHVVTVGEVELRGKEILYFETSVGKRNIVLHTLDKTYNGIGTMAEYEKQMQPFGFFLTHRSFLVNFEWIKDFTKTSVILKNEEEIDLSIRKYTAFKKSFFAWKIRRGNG